MGIDGRAIILAMRQEKVKKAGKLPDKDYDMMLLEKNNYPFRNYRHLKKRTPALEREEAAEKKKSVFFPGCNLPSFYPETTKTLIRLFAEQEIGVVFDCCGKPIAELGLKEREETIAEAIENKLKAYGVTELIAACPNCCSHLKASFREIAVVGVYEKLAELGIGRRLREDISVFLPCPDRERKELLKQIECFVDGELNIITEAACCGLGGCAAAKEPELSRDMARGVSRAGYEKIYTYCASCAGNLTRNGCEGVTHMLAEILETNEKPDISGSFLNRAKTKFW